MSSHSIGPDSIPDTEGLGSGQRETARQKKGPETMAFENDLGIKAVNLSPEESRGYEELPSVGPFFRDEI